MSDTPRTDAIGLQYFSEPFPRRMTDLARTLERELAEVTACERDNFRRAEDNLRMRDDAIRELEEQKTRASKAIIHAHAKYERRMKAELAERDAYAEALHQAAQWLLIVSEAPHPDDAQLRGAQADLRAALAKNPINGESVEGEVSTERHGLAMRESQGRLHSDPSPDQSPTNSPPQTGGGPGTYKGHKFDCNLLIEGGEMRCTCGAAPSVRQCSGCGVLESDDTPGSKCGDGIHTFHCLEPSDREKALLEGQELLKAQTARIRRAALGLSEAEPDTRPGVDTEEIVRELRTGLEALGKLLAERESPRQGPSDDARDAARYRWLRQRNHIIAKLAREFHNDLLDDAIDVAMGESLSPCNGQRGRPGGPCIEDPEAQCDGRGKCCPPPGVGGGDG